MWKIRATLIAMAGILLIFVPGVRADSLQLKNGNFVQGKYLGGTERSVQFEVNGKVRLYAVDEILSINFAAASADGGIPSNSVNREPHSTTGLKPVARGSNGLRSAVLEKAGPTRVSAKPVAAIRNGPDGAALGPRRIAVRCSGAVAPNSDAKMSVKAIATRSANIPRQPSPLLVN